MQGASGAASLQGPMRLINHTPRSIKLSSSSFSRVIFLLRFGGPLCIPPLTVAACAFVGRIGSDWAVVVFVVILGMVGGLVSSLFGGGGCGGRRPSVRL